jgi:hypothetical protein
VIDRIAKYEKLPRTDDYIHELSDIERELLQAYFRAKGLPEFIRAKLDGVEWTEKETMEIIAELRVMVVGAV